MTTVSVNLELTDIHRLVEGMKNKRRYAKAIKGWFYDEDDEENRERLLSFLRAIHGDAIKEYEDSTTDELFAALDEALEGHSEDEYPGASDEYLRVLDDLIPRALDKRDQGATSIDDLRKAVVWELPEVIAEQGRGLPVQRAGCAPRDYGSPGRVPGRGQEDLEELQSKVSFFKHIQARLVIAAAAPQF